MTNIYIEILKVMIPLLIIELCISIVLLVKLIKDVRNGDNMNKYERRFYKKKSKDELIDIIEEYEEDLKNYYILLGLRQKRTLIKKFDEEYDKEDKKKNPNRTYAGVMPDAEEVYKRYYNQKDALRYLLKNMRKGLKYLGKEDIEACRKVLERSELLLEQFR